MNPASSAGRAVESTLNYLVSRFLKKQEIEAGGERSVFHATEGRSQYDVIMKRGDECVGIEAKFVDRKAARKSAEGRLGMAWMDAPVRHAVALVYPASLRDAEAGSEKEALEACQDLAFSFSRLAGSEDGVVLEDIEREAQWTEWETGSISDLAERLRNYWIEEVDPIDPLLARLREAVEAAASSLLVRDANRAALVKAMELDRLDLDDEAAMRIVALIWTNALTFHHLLADGVEDMGIRPPVPPLRRNEILEQWQVILNTNWHPIFHLAREALKVAGTKSADRALECLRPAANSLARSADARRHDLAGRVFHRLLIGGKYLSPNYTTIPAAVLLSRLALSGFSDKDFGDEATLKSFRVSDPSCGTGTLLVAASQEIRTLHRRARYAKKERESEDMHNLLLHHIIHGYDVVHAAVHLTAANLSMAEAQRKIQHMNLQSMPLVVERRGKSAEARLGSLDYLASNSGSRDPISLFTELDGRGEAVSGTGARRIQDMPMVDLSILNPPYFKAQGITEKAEGGGRKWKDPFGFMQDPKDQKMMKEELQRRLQSTPASMLAGGSAFVQLAHEHTRPGGRIALVLPETMITGASWAGIRRLFAADYDLEWLVVSHDNRERSKRKDAEGRIFRSFSESTRLSEALLVLRKRKEKKRRGSHIAKVVNLRRNPDHPFMAQKVAKDIMTGARSKQVPRIDATPGETFDIPGEDGSWGEVLAVSLDGFQDIGAPLSLASALCSTELLQHTHRLRQGEFNLSNGKGHVSIPVRPLEEIAERGPRDIAIKGPSGPCEIKEGYSGGSSGWPALWHRDQGDHTKMALRSNATLLAKAGRGKKADAVRARRSRLSIATMLRFTSQGVAAGCSKQATLGVASWNSLTMKSKEKDGRLALREKALAMWLNSTQGLLLYITRANRPCSQRVGMPLEVMRSLPVLDVLSLSPKRLEAAGEAWDSLSKRDLMPVSDMAIDPVRAALDEALLSKVLGLSDAALARNAEIRARLAAEPTMLRRPKRPRAAALAPPGAADPAGPAA